MNSRCTATVTSVTFNCHYFGNGSRWWLVVIGAGQWSMGPYSLNLDINENIYVIDNLDGQWRWIWLSMPMIQVVVGL